MVSSRARVHGSDKDAVSRKGERSAGAADGDDAILQRLAQRFQIARTELGQLIQERLTEPMSVSRLYWQRLLVIGEANS